jgi:hypothetical protein
MQTVFLSYAREVIALASETKRTDQASTQEVIRQLAEISGARTY